MKISSFIPGLALFTAVYAAPTSEANTDLSNSKRDGAHSLYLCNNQ